MQAEKEHGVEDPYYCLSDFVAPLDTNVKDYIGCFAVSVMGAEDMAKKYVKLCVIHEKPSFTTFPNTEKKVE